MDGSNYLHHPGGIMPERIRPLSRSLRVLLLVSAALALGLGGARAQSIPDEFTNLQVLPEEIGQPELVGLMRSFSRALGVRCSYCHTVSDGLNRPDDDFASDDKARKRKARLMLRMVNRINDETLPALPDRASPEVEVSCGTCHGGLPRPVPIDREVEHLIGERGIDAALVRYRELRDQYYGTRAYDFGAGPLNRLAQRLAAGERAHQAVRVLQLNLEYSPTSLPTLLMLGEAHEADGDQESALRVYRSILDLDSNDPFYDLYAGRARERIDAIGGGG
ncbi:MAG: c-type cytochrome [Gemmatimonadetes bacterium]|nr:c-type cytochrome [Gemmatimonadota bacterium]